MIDAKVLRVIDGDTIEVEAKLKIRLDFINAPETKGIEKQGGLVSKQWLKNRIEGQDVSLDIKKEDMYNRFLSVIYKDGININGEMLEKKLAEVYAPNRQNDGKTE